MSCPFCISSELEPRSFYKNGNWLAFLAAPAHTRGHTILAAVGSQDKCPKNPDKVVLSGIGDALANVIQALKTHFKPKDVLFASLRQALPHFHVHLIPLWKEQEANWRKSKADQSVYGKGHLLEYLGILEQRGDLNAADERGINGWSEDEQRENTMRQPQFRCDVIKLRGITDYDKS